MKRHIKRYMNHIGLVCAVLTAATASAVWSREARMTDMDGDGYKEAEVFYGPEGIVRTLVDSDRDGRRETVIYYKGGHRDYAVQDRDGDGKPDLRTTYEPNGKVLVLVQQSSDDDKDGIFENYSGITAVRKQAIVPHSLAEALLR